MIKKNLFFLDFVVVSHGKFRLHATMWKLILGLVHQMFMLGFRIKCKHTKLIELKQEITAQILNFSPKKLHFEVGNPVVA